ncbi:lamin tail domain-containing protein [Leadbettera azotonutricia]|uniref:Putative lipoprotein n=1 Tax=Leadbettera azotonutricia (strain ATCC BAA-888 / DSM 13862 / ZAS-9) TaxID=545695 RepID=F5Y761_LEAAZ|nr:lamin tail domain-containing protein [Leadbettera azotonutricia]AEF82239.1 putative lipoprotein [Leadbettera azotonutricia ZAS-9]
MNKNKLFKFLSLILGLAVLVSCSNFFEPSSRDDGGTYITVDLEGDMRTLLPAASQFTKYTLKAARETQSETINITSMPQRITLSPGTWTIDAEAFVTVNGEQVSAAAGSIVVSDLAAGENRAVSIRLAMPDTQGTGIFDYTVALPAIPFNSAKMILTPLFGSPRTDIEYDLLNQLSGKNFLPSGYYLLRTIMEYNSLKAGKVEVVHIYPNMDTRAVYEFSSGDFIEQKVLIWQMYASSVDSTSTNGAVSHNFVELYNPTDAEINLAGYSLQYGYVGKDAEENPVYPDNYHDDIAWEKLDLSGTIPAHSSFLVLGKLWNADSRLDLGELIPDQAWDIAFENRNFKFCLIKSTAVLMVQNPFDINGDGSGVRAAGYVDMFGGINSNKPKDRDIINGYEGPKSYWDTKNWPEIVSKQKAARRINLVDTNDNTLDFEPIDYRPSGITDKQLPLYQPKNSDYGPWDPVAVPEILILQAYGTGTASDGSVSHNFIELYNPGKKDISLAGYSVQYSTSGASWNKLNLTGIIKAGHSFLILGAKNNTAARLQIAEITADMIWPGQVFDNKKFKIALVRSTDTLLAANPFNTGSGNPVAGYVDMVGAVNKASDGDVIDAFEGSGSNGPELISKNKSARRKTVIDTNSNVDDFEGIDYRKAGIADDALAAFYGPKGSVYGEWDPKYTPPPPVASETPIVILQAYGSGGKIDAAVSHSFVELYNTTDSAINLSGYTLQYSSKGTSWDVLPLTGSIPARTSFLILGKQSNNTGEVLPRVVLADDDFDTADQAWDIDLSNDAFKICLVHGTNPITTVNPYVAVIAGYVDMLGAGTADGFEAAPAAGISKQKTARRKTLTDTNNNAADFEIIEYRAQGGLSAEELLFYQPKNRFYGSWTPVRTAQSAQGLLILQVYGPGNSKDSDGVVTDGAVSRSFIELYNNTDTAIDLGTYSIQYSEGGNNWDKLNLSGIVPAHTSYLILGAAHNTAPRLTLNDNEGDKIWLGKDLSRERIKICLLSNQTLLTTANPYNDGSPVSGYVDMAGSGNNDNETHIDAFENSGDSDLTSCPQLLSRQKSMRRKSLIDSNNNRVDFTSIDYRAEKTNDDLLKIYRPKNIAYGIWDTVTAMD